MSAAPLIVVSGQASPVLVCIADELRFGGARVVVVEEEARIQSAKKQPAGFAQRAIESIAARTLAALDEKTRQAFDGYWTKRASDCDAIMIHRVSSLNNPAGRDLLTSLRPDLMLTYGPRILKESTFSIPRLGTLNIHTGKFPEFRGTMPEFWTLAAGRPQDVGVSVHRMSKTLDAGDLLVWLAAPARRGEHWLNARTRCLRRLLAWLPSLVEQLQNETLSFSQQDATKAQTLRTPGAWPQLVRRLRTRTTRDHDTQPYWPGHAKAAFAIASDLDTSTPERSELVRRFFRTEEDTEWGRGLGWGDFADSVFGLTRSKEERNSLRIFADPNAEHRALDSGEVARRILEGSIDTLHSWGDYSEGGGFSRHHAENIVNWLKALDLSLPVWSNHGDSDNIQNIGLSWNTGDLPSSPAYAADLLKACGVRYLWLHELSNVPAQGVTLSMQEKLQHAEGRGRLRALALLLARLWRQTRQPDLLKVIHRLGWSFRDDQSLLKRVRLRDGQIFPVFTRYGRWDAADWATMHQMLTRNAMDALIARGGAMIFYTHLGKGEPTAEALACLHHINGLRQAGELWVTSVPKLLDHYQRHGPRELKTIEWDQLEVR